MATLLLTAFVFFVYPAFALDFPEYDLTQHPFHTDPQFANLQKTPAIVRSYFAYLGGRQTLTDIRFLPRLASYAHYDDKTPFANDLDALYVPRGAETDKMREDFLTVKLNGPARVFVLMSDGKLEEKVLALNDKLDVQGLGKEWGMPRKVQTVDKKTIVIPKNERNADALRFPGVAVCVESVVTNGELVLPSPRQLSVNKWPMHQYFVLFARPDGSHHAPRAFPYQKLPARVVNRQTGREVKVEGVKSSETCPQWVHDMYVTENRDAQMGMKTGELKYWKTWHPAIDPFFWCYIGHEHGTYPGKYMPLFDYVPWKTPDVTTSHGRQEESNEGFKVFSIPVHEEGRYVVMVVHMHLSKARRFFTRFHTVIFTVLDKNWKVEMELHMKGDFGFASAAASPWVNEVLFLTEADKQLKRKLEKIRNVAKRKFNILNMDDFPNHVNTSFATSGNAAPTFKNLNTIMSGVYEQWVTPLNTCSRGAHTQRTHGFRIDCRDAATAKKALGAGDTMTMLSGSSVDRVLMMAEAMAVGPEFCSFFKKGGLSKFRRSDGVFYTDPYFSKVLAGPDKFAIRQYIAPEFSQVVVPGGKRTPFNCWDGHLEIDSIVGRRLMNAENAALPQEN